MTQGGYPSAMRASDDDRARVQTILNDAYAEGRLSPGEWEERTGDLGTAATYADLDRLTADLPPLALTVQPGAVYATAPYPAAPPVQADGINGLAAASLAFGIGQILFFLPATIAAIVLGHRGRRQIRSTGERGDGLARAGLVLGYAGLVLELLAVLIVVLIVIAIFHS
ncbi:MAG: DUF1707 and DUF4190 domain-containing protein [Streptosporangiaceae bacterium]